MSENGHPLRAVAARVEERLAHRRALERACCRKPRRRVVHEFRTETRRLLAALRLLEPVLPHRKWKAACKLLNAQLDATSKLRDVQVQQKSVRTLAAGHRDLEPLRQELDRRERNRRRKLIEELKRRRHPRRLRIFGDALGELTTTGIPNEAEAETEMRAMLRRAARKIEWLRRNAGDDPEQLHRLRMALKRYRYMREAIADGAELEPLHRAQTCLGDIHDLALLEARVRQFACQHPEGGTHDSTLRLLAHRRERRQRQQGQIMAALARTSGAGLNQPAR